MNDNQIKALISKLRSNTLREDELAELKKLFLSLAHSKTLLRILQDDFEQIKNKLEEYPDYSNQMHTKQRIMDSIQNTSHTPASRISRFNLGWVASIAILLLSGIYYLIFTSNNSSQTNTTEWVTVNTLPGIRKKIVLPDSTEIILNGNSKITYPTLQNKDYRLVKIEGEGFFKVSHDKTRPFYVIAPRFTTRVLGTSFNINTDIKSNIEVRTGKVRSYMVSSEDSEENIHAHFTTNRNADISEKNAIELIEGEEAILHNNEWTKQDHNNNFWFNNELVYFAEPLKNVIKSAYRNFGDSISIDKKLEDVSITITFRGKNKEQVIYTLAELAQANVKINNKTKVWEMTAK